jgi:hypothetical protein
MPEAATQPATIPDLRRASDTDYRAGLDALVKELSQQEAEHPLEVPKRTLAHLNHSDYEKELHALARRLQRQGTR